MWWKYAEMTELYIPWSELSWRKLSPTLTSTNCSCPDNAIGRQLGGNFIITTNVYVDQTLCPLPNPHKLNIGCNRNTENIKIIKIAVKSANSCREKYATCALCWNMRKCGNMRSLRWLYIGVQLTCLTDADLYNGCKAVVVCMNAV